jgi:hypothetical protein
MPERQILKDACLPAAQACLNDIDTIPTSVLLERADRL